MKISYEEFIIILKQKDEYKKIKENVRNLSEKLEEKQENIRLNGVHSRKTRLQRCDLLKSIKHLHHQKFLFVCVCMYNMLTYRIKTWSKIIGVEVIKYNDKKWINEKHLEIALR